VSNALREVLVVALDLTGAAAITHPMALAVIASCSVLMSACGVTVRGSAHIEAAHSVTSQASTVPSATAIRRSEARGGLAALASYRKVSSPGFPGTEAEGGAHARLANRASAHRSGAAAPADAIGTFPQPGAADSAPSYARAGVDQVTLQSLPDGSELTHIALDVPSSMTLDKSTLIRVALGRRGPQGTLSDNGTADDALPDRAAPRLMEARLSGSGFEIDALTSARQAYPMRQPTQWTWRVTPKKAGRQELHLTVSAIAGGDGSAQRLFPTLDHSVEVGMTWSDRGRAFLESHSLWVWAASAVLLAAAIWRYARRRARRRLWFRGSL
jgi:hypothetical protein